MHEFAADWLDVPYANFASTGVEYGQATACYT